MSEILSVYDINQHYYHVNDLDNVPLEKLQASVAVFWNQLHQLSKEVKIILSNKSGMLDFPDYLSYSYCSDIIRCCDAIRICHRKPIQVEDHDFIANVNSLLHSNDCFFNASHVHDNEVSLALLKCLVNLLFGQSSRMKLFCSFQVNGVEKLCSLLRTCSASNFDDSVGVYQYVVKVLYMIQSSNVNIENSMLLDHCTGIEVILSLVLVLLHAFQRIHKSNDVDSSSMVAVISFYCDVCKLLYALNCFQLLETDSAPTSDSFGFVCTPSAENNEFDFLNCNLKLASKPLYEYSPEQEVSCLSLLCSVLLYTLLLPDSSSEAAANCQQSALQLCMIASQHSVDQVIALNSSYLLASGSVVLSLSSIVTRLGNILRRSLEEARSFSQTTTADHDKQTHLLSPILVLCSRMIQNNAECRAELKKLVFPNPFVKPSSSSASSSAIDPSDVPENSLRGLLVPLMISLNTQVKRCVAELIYTMCDCDKDEFIFRTGFGNAVALLQIKGFL